MNFLFKIFGDANERYLRDLKPIVEKINFHEVDFMSLDLPGLKKKTGELKEQLKNGKTLDEILPEAFALAREAAKRTLGQRHFDEQLMGGVALHQGKIAEMRTGEGKTLTATLAAYLNGLTSDGVHIVTVNDYLARRDTVWMGQIYYTLGLSVGCINPNDQSYVYDPEHTQKSQILNPNFQKNPNDQNSKTDKLDELRDITGGFKVVHEFLRPVSKKEAYACDIVYGTNTEFGFDYLRDNLVQSFDQMVSPKRNYAIVDEVDSILIDEARTPLIISVPDSESPKLYESFARIAPRLQENVDYNVDEKMRTAIITEEGLSKVERILGIGNIYNEQGVKYVHHLENALKAQALFHKDKEYVVKDDQVIIVDEFTGRMLQGRRYSEGLHQAIEAKEGVKVERESRTLATITFQNFFRLYSKLAGMTGTAATSAEELHKVYGLDVAIIPTHKPMVRRDLADQIYKNEDVKFRAVARDIKERNEKGQPVLVGTISIENNEKLSRLLLREGIAHEMLNAKQHEREGSIIAQAGKPRAVTIATNMAGRGVDIILGGNPPTPEEAETVRKAGGLHVIGTERHEARRIDNQLRGRAGRQGDPGSSQFYVSLGDHLMRVFGGDRIRGLMERLNMPEDQPIENSFISKALESAQSKIEGLNFDARKHLLEYDDVMNKHRTAIYKKRLDILSGHVHKGSAFDLLKKTVKAIFDFHVQSDQFWSDWLREEVFENLKAFLPIGQEQKEFLAKAATRDEVENYFLEVVIKIYEEKEKRVGARVMREIERMVMLNSLDNLWMNHLEDMEHLRDSVRLRAYGQRDPLVEYKNEAHGLFNSLLRNFEEQVAMMILKVEPLNVTPVGEPTAPPARNLNAEPETKVPASKVSPKGREVGRNDPCWCGSGKKFKKCHGK